MQQSGEAWSRTLRFDQSERNTCQCMGWRAHQSKKPTYQKPFLTMMSGPRGQPIRTRPRSVDSPSSLPTRPTSPHPPFMLPCWPVHHVGCPWLYSASLGPWAKSARVLPRTLTLGLHLASSTVTSYPTPALHNQGKHQHTTVANHSSHQGWSPLILNI